MQSEARTHPVFHELRRLLNGIPLDARDARDGTFIHGREHVLQPVARLMKESRALVKRHQRRCNYRPCRRVRNRRSLIAHEDGHWQTRRCARRGHHTRAAHLSIHARWRGTQWPSEALGGIDRHREAFRSIQRPSEAIISPPHSSTRRPFSPPAGRTDRGRSSRRPPHRASPRTAAPAHPTPARPRCSARSTPCSKEARVISGN